MARVPMSERTRNELKEMFAGKRGADRSGLVRHSADVALMRSDRTTVTVVGAEGTMNMTTMATDADDLLRVISGFRESYSLTKAPCRIDDLASSAVQNGAVPRRVVRSMRRRRGKS